ncbi:MAG: hypothetical protein EXS28_06315 [Pedosphaera sp.]|nr:hypothetical protein [Pedosphaera sp.]
MQTRGPKHLRARAWNRRRKGVAFVMVLLVILVLAALAGGFASNMRIEAALARNTSNERRLEWLCRSGVEMARYLVGQQAAIRQQPFTALNQKWATNSGSTNTILTYINTADTGLAEGNVLGLLQNGDEEWQEFLKAAKVKVEIVDLERKLNINWVAQQHYGRHPMERAMRDDMMAVPNTAWSTVIDCIEDWVDPNGDARINGAEGSYYRAFGYDSKNTLIDDLSELLMIKGIRGEREWLVTGRIPENLPLIERPRFLFTDLFTPISAGRVNINTAPREVLVLINAAFEDSVDSIIRSRNGPDGIAGTEDDKPFQQVAELADPLIGFSPQAVGQLQRFLSVQSVTFEVTVTASVNNQVKTLVTVIRRLSDRDVKVLYSFWKETGE